jgi:hypothetical protein
LLPWVSAARDALADVSNCGVDAPAQQLRQQGLEEGGRGTLANCAGARASSKLSRGRRASRVRFPVLASRQRQRGGRAFARGGDQIDRNAVDRPAARVRPAVPLGDATGRSCHSPSFSEGSIHGRLHHLRREVAVRREIAEEFGTLRGPTAKVRYPESAFRRHSKTQPSPVTSNDSNIGRNCSAGIAAHCVLSPLIIWPWLPGTPRFHTGTMLPCVTNAFNDLISSFR